MENDGAFLEVRGLKPEGDAEGFVALEVANLGVDRVVARKLNRVSSVT